MNENFARVPNGFDSFGPWFNESIELLKAQWQTWVLISLIYLAIAGGASYAISYRLPVVGSLVGLVASAFLMPGMIRAGIKQIRGGTIEVGDLFSATDMFVGALVVLLASIAGVIACGIGAFVTSALFYLALPLLVDKNLAFGDALKQSMELTKQNLGFFIVYALVIGIVSGLGLVACGVGILITFPLRTLGMVVAYERTFNTPAIQEATPPPPTTE